MLRLSSRDRLIHKVRGIPAKLRRLLRSVQVGQAQPNDAWAEQYLNAGEQLIYRGMDARDREHGCRITRLLLRDYPQASSELIAAALLHDSGKSVRPYHVIERVLVGLIPGWLIPFLPPLGPIGIRAGHPELGAQLIVRAGGRPRVAQLVVRHHASVGDPEAALLHYYDDME